MIIAPYLQLDYKKYGIKKIFYFEESSLTIFPPAFHNLPYATVTITPKEKKKKKKIHHTNFLQSFCNLRSTKRERPPEKKKESPFYNRTKDPPKKF